MKKLLSLFLALAMLFSLAACGGQSTSRTEEPASEPAEEAPAEEAPADAAEAPAASGDTIKIGMYTPMTGTNAGSGLAGMYGAQLAIDEVNAAGGINGSQLELISYDDAGTTEGATKAATRLIEEDGVKVLLGSFQSPSVLAVSELTEKAQVLHIGTGTGATWTNIGLDYTYRATAIGTLTVDTMIEELVDMGMKSISLISVESEYGQSGRDAVITGAQAANIEVKADLTYQSADTDFTGIITKALAAGADTFVLYGVGNEMAMIIKQLRQNGYEDLIFTIEGGANSEIFTVAGASADGLVFSAAYVIPTTPEESTSELQKDVLTRYYNQYGEMPYSDVFYRGYDQMMLAAEALKNCSDVTSGQSIMEAFRAISGVELLGGSFDFTAGTGDGLTAANKYMIMDGVIKAYDKAALEAWRP